ncbi:hypothetical protein [uncultured Shimia sp.]|uniref:hypothetical protein n=1 Tax=uncultured Shimia sp. TaxID=573152 RepID=UPI0026050AB6|nr:hypothetical protein [uncultured Shimia sp.]
MSAPVCESKAQCQINGLAGTAMVMSLMILAWAGIEAVRSGMTGSEAALLAPTLVSAVCAVAARMRRQVFGWLGLAIVAGGTVWGIFVLNGVIGL